MQLKEILLATSTVGTGRVVFFAVLHPRLFTYIRTVEGETSYNLP